MKKRYLIPMFLFLIVTNVYAITSNDVTYNNEGTEESLTTTLDNLYSELNKYKTGGSVTSNQMLEGATGYSKGELVTGTIKSKGITTYTPGTSNQTIAAGQYLSGAQTIKGDANLVAGNIAKGKSIFGVSGTYTSDANATAANILKDKTAYVNGSKVTGTITSKGATTYKPGTSNQTIAAGQYLSGAQTIQGDANLVASNIITGKSIFGVSGTHQAKNHAPNLIWWAADAMAADRYAETFTETLTYTFPDSTYLSLSLYAGLSGYNLTDSLWTTSVTVNNVAKSSFDTMKSNSWENMRTWIFAVEKGQTIKVTNKVQCPTGVQCFRYLGAYMFGLQNANYNGPLW